MNAGLKVVGEGMRLEECVVCDGAEGVVFPAKFLLQLQGLLESSLFVRRLSAGIEQRSVCSIFGLQTSFLHLEETHSIIKDCIICWLKLGNFKGSSRKMVLCMLNRSGTRSDMSEKTLNTHAIPTSL